jgi:hypothetical protein
MANEPKKGQKPSGDIEGAKVAQGKKSAPKEGEVAAHMSPGAYYLCWNDGASNYVPFGWNFFYCWSCGAFNRV